MGKEILTQNPEIERLAVGLGATFIQRRDLYARQLEDGSYICVHNPLETSHLLEHLNGRITLGAYVLDQASQASYIVFDADDDGQKDSLIGMARRLEEQAVPSYLESSRRGAHLWLFFSEPVSGKEARLFGKGLMREFDLSQIELFPKQEKLADGPGSLVRLPFGVHRKIGQRYGFLNLDLQPLAPSLAKQISILSAPETVPNDFLKARLINPSPTLPKTCAVGIETSTAPLSRRVKDTISVFDFVSQYVELSPNGRGLCPFHDDHHHSFSVDQKRNYWYCFAGCGGGSIIDFWIKREGCDFKIAVRDLAEKLL